MVVPVLMVKDHTKTSDELKAMVKSGDVKAELATQLDSSHQSKLDKLGGYKGDDFTSEFASQQVSAHKEAVNLFERYAKGGDNPRLKDWAGKTLPAPAAPSGDGASPEKVTLLRAREAQV